MKSLERRRSTTAIRKLVLVVLLCCWSVVLPTAFGADADTGILCISSEDCEGDCVAGSCATIEEQPLKNPFYSGGCLHSMGWSNNLRVCNSDDAPEAAERGHCQQPDPGLDYMEIRIHSQNWESVFFESWVMQILLSEFLKVPATIETGTPDAEISFYNVDNRFEYGTSYDWDALRLGAEYVDCQKVPQQDDGAYQSCAHVIPEVWNGHLAKVRELTQEGVTEHAQALGSLGQQSWFIPKFTGMRDPTVSSFLGLQGDENRRKLADLFLRPTTWGVYCDIVSTHNCSFDDGIAVRAPEDAVERDRMFVEGVYTGHFRKTEKNDCDANPTNCTGHIADYPCGWSSYVGPQTHHLNIALSSDGDEPGSNGYRYSQLIEIWAAANATRSNVILQWWTPEVLVQQYANSDAEFLPVSLPPPSQDCIDARIYVKDRCAPDLETRVGDPIGACAEAPHPVQKVLSTGLLKSTVDSSKSAGQKSPAYDAVNNFEMSALQVSKFFDNWVAGAGPNIDPREAACQWVVDNIDLVSEFIPATYPRVLREQMQIGILFWISIICAGVGAFLAVTATLLTFKYRDNKVLKFAQIEFLWLLLVGLLLVTVGSIVLSLPPTNGSCIAGIWLVHLGYTFELVPLVVKIAAVNRLMQAAKKMKRIVLRRRSLFGTVALLSALAVIFLSLWTLLDPPRKETFHELTSETTPDGETIVLTLNYCDSESNVWNYTAVAWNFLYLIVATVLAFQTRNVVEDFNESQTLTIMIYSHFIFVLMRVVTFFLEGSALNVADVARIRSLLFSCDAIATVCIYFLPKLWAAAHTLDLNASANLDFPARSSAEQATRDGAAEDAGAFRRRVSLNSMSRVSGNFPHSIYFEEEQGASLSHNLHIHAGPLKRKLSSGSTQDDYSAIYRRSSSSCKFCGKGGYDSDNKYDKVLSGSDTDPEFEQPYRRGSDVLATVMSESQDTVEEETAPLAGGQDTPPPHVIYNDSTNEDVDVSGWVDDTNNNNNNNNKHDNNMVEDNSGWALDAVEEAILGGKDVNND